MTVGNSGGCVIGQVALRIPLLDPNDVSRATTIPLKGVTVVLRAKGSRSGKGKQVSELLTDSDGMFRFENLEAGSYQVCFNQEHTNYDGSHCHISGATECWSVDIPDTNASQGTPAGADEDCIDIGTITYSIEFLDHVAALTMAHLTGIKNAANQMSTGLGDIVAKTDSITYDVNKLSATATGVVHDVQNHKDLIYNTASSIAGIESALRDMATFPFTGPSTTDEGGYAQGKPHKAAPARNGVRSGVESALSGLGLNGDLTDADLERLFPAETDSDGEVHYRWSGPQPATRTAIRKNGAHAGTVQVSGALARFQQQARTALTEIQGVLATLQPFNGHDVDRETLETQKKIVLRTMQSIVDEPTRPDGVRNVAIDLHFKSLLDDPIVVERDGSTVDGNLGVLEHLLGIGDALISDQDAEVYVTEWTRVLDAAAAARTAWDLYTDQTNKPDLRFGERLQDLHGYFGALTEASMDARAMLRTVRFTPQEQASHKFNTSTSGQVTTDDLLSMVEDLAGDIGPTYISDWRGRGVGTLGARAERLAATTEELMEVTTSTGLPAFPFSSARVKGAFEDIARLLNETAAVCNQILDDMLSGARRPASSASTSKVATP